MNLLTVEILRQADSHWGVVEATPNSGPEIDGWLHRVGLVPGQPWCAAFAWCCIDDACKQLGLTNPIPAVWFQSTHKIHNHLPESTRIDTPCPGCLCLIDEGHGHGHTTLCESTNMGIEGDVVTIAGNQNNGVRRHAYHATDFAWFHDVSVMFS